MLLPPSWSKSQSSMAASSAPLNTTAPPRYTVQSVRKIGSRFSMNVRAACRNVRPRSVMNFTGFSFAAAEFNQLSQPHDFHGRRFQIQAGGRDEIAASGSVAS